jgi:putative pyruvate formate lyase activating enzyme
MRNDGVREGRHNTSERTFIPAYQRISRPELEERVLKAEEALRSCTLCPRECRVDRTAGKRGFCRTGDRPFVSSWGPHFGEERPLVGRHGSGTIFFGNCNLGCLFCQNYTISHLGEGSETSVEALADVMLELQSLGCHNINLVTPTHQMPMILRALLISSENGLRLPIVYNCGGYESLGALRLLEGIVDIYMPDIKYADPEAALRYSKARDYPDAVRKAVKEMHRQVGDLVMDGEGVALRGLLVRHLVLPENMAGTAEVVRFIVEEISKNTYVNIMDQYRPCYQAGKHPPLDRRITAREFRDAVDCALKAGLRRLDGITVP